MPLKQPATLPILDEGEAADATIFVVAARDYAQWRETAPAAAASWLDAIGFQPEIDAGALLPAADGGFQGAIVTVGDRPGPWTFAALTERLPKGRYRMETLAEIDPDLAAIGWCLGQYRYTFGSGADSTNTRWLALPKGADRAAIVRATEAVTMVRTLVNRPAADLGPEELAEEAAGLAERHGASIRVIEGDDLLSEGYPAIHAVGRASDRAPRLIDLGWGDADAPAVTLIGKGVCFDTGGLNIKPGNSMRLMKKDMGGAAHALGLAHMIMDAGLPVRLRVLIPAVDNAISGSAFRPGDVIRTREGLTVEVGDTDAEGRLVLADALSEAKSDRPEFLVDFATLTGAARVALGPEIGVMFTNNDETATRLTWHSEAVHDPIWRLPLWQPYRKTLSSKIADTCNISGGPFAGAITAALFLENFVSADTCWVHYDLYAWNPNARPGRPEGGEAQAMRATFETIAERYGGGDRDP